MNLTRLVVAGLFIATCSTTLQADEKSQSRTDRRPGFERYREAISKYDKNGNGRLDGEEREAFAKAYREKLAERKKESDKTEKSEDAAKKRPSWGGPPRGPWQRGRDGRSSRDGDRKGEEAASKRPSWGGPSRGPGKGPRDWQGSKGSDKKSVSKRPSWGGPSRGPWKGPRDWQGSKESDKKSVSKRPSWGRPPMRPSGRPDGDRQSRFKEAMKKYDRDQDGKLSEKERGEMFAAMRKRFEEMREQAKKSESGDRKGPPWSSRWSHGDSKPGERAKGDAKSPERSYRGRGPSRGDGDQGRSRREADRGNESRNSRVAEMVVSHAMRGDKNDDGKLNADEFPQRTAKPFGFYDTDRDGYVTRDELMAGLKKNMASRSGR